MRRNILTTQNPSFALEALEGRKVMSTSPLNFSAYYPEGYVSDNVNEYVPITNPNSVEVEFELHARYEFGERDQLISSGRIPAASRGGITINDTNFPDDRLVRKDIPYALILKSSLPVSATISHYDFGTAIGESFTTRTDDTWTFGDGKRDDLTRDFFLVYNPDDSAKTVTMTLYGANGQSKSVSLVLEGQRRGGWSVEDISDQPRGVFAAKIVASGPVVAAQSHYELNSQRGYGAIGQAGGGQFAGVVPTINFDDSFYERNGDDSPHRSGDPTIPRMRADSYISILNSDSQAATVTLTFLYDDRLGLAPVRRVVTVQPNSRSTFSVRDNVARADDDEMSVVYRSTRPVTVSGSVYQGMDATGVEAATKAADVWDFGEGFMSNSRGGVGVREDLYVFNPTSRRVNFSVDFLFTDGTKLTVESHASSVETRHLSLHNITELRARAESSWYGIRIRAQGNVVASMQHWDSSVGGGFSTFGMPGGTILDVSSVLAI